MFNFNKKRINSYKYILKITKTKNKRPQFVTKCQVFLTNVHTYTSTVKKDKIVKFL